MTLVLDTSILIELERGNASLINKIRQYTQLYPSPAQITFINYFEFLNGVLNKSVKKKEKAVSFINRFNVIQTSKKTAEILAKLKNIYESKGKALSLADLLIASQTIENNLTLLTLDTDFKIVKELNKIIL